MLHIPERPNPSPKDMFQAHLREIATSGGDPMHELAHSGLSLPPHVVVIADGNGRWAKQRGLPVTEGHRKGVEVLQQLIREVDTVPQIHELTLWTLSADNIQKRSPLEIANILRLYSDTIEHLLPEMQGKGMRFIPLGDLEGLPASLRDTVLAAKKATAENSGKVLRIATNYQGFQEELALANAAISSFSQTGRRPSSRADIEALQAISQTPPADFVIRTSGELRLSDIGPIARKAEFYAPSTLLPDMTPLDWALVFSEYSFREKRGGGRPQQ